MTKKDENKNDSMKAYMVFSGIAFQMAILITGAAFLGKYLDAKYQFEKPVFTIILVLSSVLISMFLIIKKALDLSKDEDNKPKDE